MRRITRAVLIAAMACAWSGNAFAGPFEISYGGRLSESTGKPLTGPVTLRITLYRSLTGNDQVAVSIPDFTGVVLQEGIFQITLSLSPADFHTAFNGTDATYIQVEDLSHNVTYPRQKFSAIPYALKVPVDDETITYTSDGRLTLGASGGAAGRFLKFDSPGVLVWDNIPGGGDMLKSNNLSDLTSAATARTNLGLGAAATKGVGTAAGDVAAGNHTHATSDVAGLGGLATKNTVGSAEITDSSVTGTDIASGTITDAHINATANISYLKISGLGSAASKNVGTAAGDVAAGNHTHATSDVPGLGSLATKSTVGSSDITDGSIADADVSASAAIAGSKINPNFGVQNVTTTGSLSANGVTAEALQANTNLKLKSDNANTVTLQAPASLGSAYTMTFPADTGTNGQVLTTNGSGGLSWGTVSGGGGGGGDMFKADNLSGLANTATARTNLGLGGLATKSAVGSSDISDGSVTGTDMASGTITDANISPSAAISPSKISGLGGLATKSAVGSSDITDGSVTGTDMASGTITDAHINATANISHLKISGLGSLASKSTVGSSDITDGSIADADVSASAAIAGSKVNPNFGAQTIATTGNSSVGGDMTIGGYAKIATTTGAPPATDCDAAAEYGRMKVDSNSGVNFLYVCTADGWKTTSLTAPSRRESLMVIDQKTTGTVSQTVPGSTWTAWQLNTTLVDAGSNILSNTSGVLNLKAGTYECDAAILISGAAHKARLRNTSAGSNLGSSDFAGAGATSRLVAAFTLASNSNVALEVYCPSSCGSSAANYAGNPEVYGMLKCVRTN